MNNINESTVSTVKTIGDLLLAARDGYNSAAEKQKGPQTRRYSYTSVAQASSKMVAVYPLLCSRNVSLETAQMVSKYLEAKGAQMLQLALQANNIYDARSGMEYLSRFHQNLNVGGSSFDVFGRAIDAMLKDEKEQAVKDRRDKLKDADEKANALGLAVLASATVEDEVDAAFNEYFTANDTTYKISSRDFNDLLKLIQEFSDNGFVEPYDTNLNPISLNDYIVNESYGGEYTVSLKVLREEDEESTQDRIKRYRSDRKYNKVAGKIASTRGYGTFLKDQDVKKMNDALSTILVVRFYNSENSINYTEFLVGVKTSVIPVNTDEILKRIANDNEDGKFFTNLIRVGTGEIGALDFIFGLSRTADELNSIKKKGSLGDTWRLLQNRAYAAREAVKRNKTNPFAAITTVIITKEDADLLYKEENIDITKPGVAKHFMRSYNLLGFGIVNDVIESLNIMFDDDNNYFEELSYKMLQRENNNDVIVKAMSLANKIR